MRKLNLNRKLVPFSIFLGLVGLLAITYWVRNANLTVDLTAEKKFTISEVTIKKVKELRQPIEIKVFLEPDLNSGFRLLYRSIAQTLRQIQRYNRQNVVVEFVEPDGLKKNEKKAFNKMVEKHQMLPVNVVDEDNQGKVTQKSVFPWALLSYNDKEFPVKLLQNLPGRSADENLNLSIEGLEYSLVDAIRILTIKKNERIAFLEGHEELNEDEVYDLTTALSRYFSVDRGRVGNSLDVLKPYKCLLIARPLQKFSEQEKFVIDQYLMQGGKLIWMVDGVGLSMDSLLTRPSAMGLHNDVGLTEMLFAYGVRINPVLVSDLQCAKVTVNINPEGSAANFKPLPWVYAPIFNASNRHPITRSTAPIKGEFVSTIDLVSARKTVSKTVIMTTGRQTSLQAVPVQISLREAIHPPDQKRFVRNPQPVAVVLEGEFTSAFLNRMPPRGVTISKDQIKNQSVPTKMLVISDGSIAKNEVQQVGNDKRIYPLGFDKVSGTVTYGNKELLVNAVNYLTDETGMLELRSRDIPLRILNKKEANQNRSKWQVLNLVLPLIMLLMSALLFGFIRKRKYGK